MMQRDWDTLRILRAGQAKILPEILSSEEIYRIIANTYSAEELEILRAISSVN
jgi:hypothetical protein